MDRPVFVSEHLPMDKYAEACSMESREEITVKSGITVDIIILPGRIMVSSEAYNKLKEMAAE